LTSADPRARATGALLWSRAGLLSSVAVLAGCTAHLGAGGTLPGPAGLALVTVSGAALAAPLLRQEAGRGRVVALLVLGQALVHGVLTALSGHRGEEVRAASGLPEWLEHLLADLSGTHALMALGHAAAAALVGLWLGVGERALWALLRRVGRFLAVIPRRATAPITRTPVVRVATDRPDPALAALGCVVRRRGPPVPALA
jgi:hypothetical protein